MRQRRCANELGVNLRQWAAVDANLHERRFDAGVVDSAFPLACPAVGQLLGGFAKRVCRHEFILGGAVIARVRQDVQARGFGQPFQESWITAKVGRRAFHQRAAPELLQLL